METLGWLLARSLEGAHISLVVVARCSADEIGRSWDLKECRYTHHLLMKEPIRITAQNTPVTQVKTQVHHFMKNPTWKASGEKKQRALLNQWIKLLELFGILNVCYNCGVLITDPQTLTINPSPPFSTCMSLLPVIIGLLISFYMVIFSPSILPMG